MTDGGGGTTDDLWQELKWRTSSTRVCLFALVLLGGACLHRCLSAGRCAFVALELSCFFLENASAMISSVVSCFLRPPSFSLSMSEPELVHISFRALHGL